MIEDVDQFKVRIGPDGTITIPAILLERKGWVPGDFLLLDETDDGVLATKGTDAESPMDQP